MFNKNNGRCMVGRLKMDRTRLMNLLKGRSRTLLRCSSSHGILGFKESIEQGIALLSLKQFKARKVNSMLQEEIQLLRTSLVRYSEVLVDRELWARPVH